MSAGAVAVELFQMADLDAVVVLHRAVFPDYNSSRLGVRFCRRMLQTYAARPDAVVLVARDPAGVARGYLVGAPPPVQRSVNDALVPWAALATLGAAVRAPKQALAAVAPALRRGLRAVRAVGTHLWSRVRPGPSPSPASSTATASSAGGPVGGAAPQGRIVLIGVDESARGTGVGGALLDGFRTWAAEAGCLRADLSVDASNDAARRAYERRGWALASLEGGGTVARYELDLAS